MLKTRSYLVVFPDMLVGHHHVDVVFVIDESVSVGFELSYEVGGLVLCKFLGAVVGEGPDQVLDFHVAAGGAAFEDLKGAFHLVGAIRRRNLPRHHGHEL